MSDTQDNDLTVTPEQELEALKARADRMGLKYHPSIGLETLRGKVNEAIQAAQNGDQNTNTQAGQAPAASTAGAAPAAAAPQDPLPPVYVEETPAQKRKRMRNEAMKLVRIRLTCMNPAKREWNGEMFTVGNSLVGSVTKFVPFNAEEGWHVPQIMLNVLRDRQCQVFSNKKTQNGVTMREGKLIKEFAIEVLPPLTEQELHDLAQRQAMSGSVQ